MVETVPNVADEEAIADIAPVRLSVNLTAEFAAALKEMAIESGTSISDVVRKAIATERFLQREQKKGSEILLETKDGSIRQVVLR